MEQNYEFLKQVNALVVEQMEGKQRDYLQLQNRFLTLSRGGNSGEGSSHSLVTHASNSPSDTSKPDWVRFVKCSISEPTDLVVEIEQLHEDYC